MELSPFLFSFWSGGDYTPNLLRLCSGNLVGSDCCSKDQQYFPHRHCNPALKYGKKKTSAYYSGYPGDYNDPYKSEDIHILPLKSETFDLVI